MNVRKHVHGTLPVKLRTCGDDCVTICLGEMNDDFTIFLDNAEDAIQLGAEIVTQAIALRKEIAEGEVD